MINIKIDDQVFNGLLVDDNHVIFLIDDILMFVEVRVVEGEKGLYEYSGKYTTLDEEGSDELRSFADLKSYLEYKKQELLEINFVTYLRKYCNHDQDYNFAFRYKGI